MTRLATWVAIAFLVSGCIGFFWPSTFPVTVVQNASPQGVVAEVTDYRGARYYAVNAGAEVTVDSVGHNNPGAHSIAILGADCMTRTEVSGEFWGGGTVTVAGAGAVTFERERSSDKRDEVGVGSCEEAATLL